MTKIKQANFNRIIAYRIKSVRKNHYVSKEDIAEVLEMSLEDYESIENGDSPMTLDTFYNIANILEMSSHLFLQGIDKDEISAGFADSYVEKKEMTDEQVVEWFNNMRENMKKYVDSCSCEECVEKRK